MTLREAIRFVEEAEKLPADKVDKEKLAEALEAIAAEEKRNFLERGLRQIGEAPTNLDRILGELKIASDNPFLPTVSKLIRNALSSASDVLQRILPGEPGPEDTDEAEKEEEEEAQPFVLSKAVPSKPVKAATRRGRRRTLNVPAGLIVRLYEAAERVGISHAQVRDVIANAESQVYQGDSPASVTLPDGTVRPGPAVDTDDTDAPTVEDILNETIAQWQVGAIGVPEGFVATRATTPDPSFFMGRPDLSQIPQATKGVLPRYFDGDEYNMAGMSPEKIANLQQKLVTTGFMDEGEYWTGVWDNATASVMRAILGMANQSGVTYQEKIEELAANVPQSVKEERARKAASKVYQGDPFLPPDPVALTETVKEAVRQKLGREPTQEDYAVLTAALGGLAFEDYQAQEAYNRAVFAQQQGVSMAQLGAGGVQGETPRLVDVDPAARFNQLFDERFGSEMQFLEDQEATFENTRRFFSSLAGVDSLIGGI